MGGLGFQAEINVKEDQKPAGQSWSRVALYLALGVAHGDISCSLQCSGKLES